MGALSPESGCRARRSSFARGSKKTHDYPQHGQRNVRIQSTEALLASANKRPQSISVRSLQAYTYSAPGFASRLELAESAG